MLPVIQRKAAGDGWNLSWDDGVELLELDLMDSGKIGWFWKDRTTDAIDGSDDDEDGFSDAFRRRAKWFEVNTDADT